MGKRQTATGGNVFAIYNCLIFAFSTTNNPFFFLAFIVKNYETSRLFFHLSGRLKLKSLLS